MTSEKGNIFQLGDFTLHSGERSSFKIECDNLTKDDWTALAYIAVNRLPFTFSEIIYIPTGGLQFAEALVKYRKSDSDLVLLVDDVLTTGSSIQQRMQKMTRDVKGLVAFARTEPPPNVYAVFQLMQ